jgi:poly(ADP-ribose) glycohydrolase ARH3
MVISQDNYSGCFFGLAVGDAFCAPYEGGILERLLWKLINKTKTGEIRYTDDTQMSLDVAKSILEQGGVNQQHLASVFAESYRWSRGYGPGAAKMLKKIKKGALWSEVNDSIFPLGSYGNGAAMRVPIVSLYYFADKENILSAVKKVSEITHCHPLAIEGASLIALSVFYSLAHIEPTLWIDNLLNYSQSAEYQSRLNIAKNWINSQQVVTYKMVIKELGNGIAAIDSCVTAIYIANRFIHMDFLAMLEFIQQCSGDTDTIAAMAGSIWGAYNGLSQLKPLMKNLESRDEIHQFSIKLYNHAIKNMNKELC